MNEVQSLGGEMRDVGGSNITSFITQNAEINEVKRKAKIVAKSQVPVLLTGENGTGKEVLAKFIHEHSCDPSDLKNKPFVTINCGAIPSELLESELFGHEKGAFTGADSKKEGVFELANGGTLFLDEIGELSCKAQVKLLRAVEYQSFRRVGGNDEINVDLRIISATNRELYDLIKSGEFREDLFYRLNVVELYLPPLRHRKDDISLLINYFISTLSKKHNLSELMIHEECIRLFSCYNWPGNIRELRNVIERCLILSDEGKINKDLLPKRIQNSENCAEYPEFDELNRSSENYVMVKIGTSLEEIEKRVIKKTLDSVNNNKSEAANILGFSRKTLHNKLQKYETSSEN